MDGITFSDLSNLAIVIMAIWGFYKVVSEIIKAITNRHDREQKWDEMSEKAKEEREEIVCKYNDQLADIRKQLTDTHTEFEGKVQEVREEQFIIIETLRAVLDGLHQQGCNGKVTEAINNLDGYLNEAAHKR
jgi:transcriptional regulator of heat shock response